MRGGRYGNRQNIEEKIEAQVNDDRMDFKKKDNPVARHPQTTTMVDTSKFRNYHQNHNNSNRNNNWNRNEETNWDRNQNGVGQYGGRNNYTNSNSNNWNNNEGDNSHERSNFYGNNSYGNTQERFNSGRGQRAEEVGENSRSRNR